MSDRRDTCIGKDCPFWVRYNNKCPNYVEGSWETVDGHKYNTQDCAPKRSMILCQQIYDHMLDVRKDYGHVRNSNERAIKLLLEMTRGPMGIGSVIDVEDAKLIEE
jgi:hypothetical protein